MFDIDNLCSTCLSRNRRLTPLTALRRVFESIPGLRSELNMQRDRVCWECRAVLERIQRFQWQAARAHHLLTLYRSTAQLVQPIESLSKLSTYTRSGDESVLYVEALKCESEDCHSYEYLDEELAKLEKNDELNNDVCFISIKQENNEIPAEIVSSDEDAEFTSSKLPETNQNLDRPSEESDFLHLTKDEEKFIVRRMSLQELYKVRDLERKGKRYNSCSYKCINCIKSFFSKEQYDAHMKKYHSKKLGSLVCPICSARFSRAHALRQHDAAHFKRYRCRACPYTHHRLHAMLVHSDTEHKLNNYSCKFCDKAFVTNMRLRYHTNKMHKARPTCKVCKKTSTSLEGLKIHMLVHNKALEECHVCGGRFKYLREHIARTHEPGAGAGGEDAYCAECGRQFRSVHTYRNHLRHHSRHRQPEALKHACTLCDAKYANKTCLTRHISSMHTKVYPFECHTCGKGFNRRDHIRYHIQEKHEGISRPKDKICNFCGKGFKLAEGLRKHVRTHTGEKPFACELCPWRFAQKTALKTHERALHRQKKDKVEQGALTEQVDHAET